MSHKLLYIPSGTFCSFHQNGSGIRTLIVEEAAICTEFVNVVETVEIFIKMIIDNPTTNFVRVNNISTPILRQEFEVIND